ncbi:hypothetical protein HPULCUR_010462 [Helicostylum pulchrum]|uniref:Uncharacterized protein n=1 Tax=Helicostylum pulchrum TaxID=562976 RepID=A0ABP9YF99_9FUNG
MTRLYRPIDLVPSGSNNTLFGNLIRSNGFDLDCLFDERTLNLEKLDDNAAEKAAFYTFYSIVTVNCTIFLISCFNLGDIYNPPFYVLSKPSQYVTVAAQFKGWKKINPY